MAIFNYKLIINHEFLKQFCPRCFALRSKAAGAKFRGGYSSGFTLTELLIVVIIIGIVSTLALPMLVKTIEKAKLGEAVSNLNLIRTGEKIYFLERGYFSGKDGEDKQAGIDFLNIEDPNSESASFTYTIETEKGATGDFTARAQRKNTAPNPYSTYYYEISKDGTISSNPAGNPLKP